MLQIRNLTRHFNGPPAVDGVSLDVGAGEFVSLLGPSGCGKTTTLRVIAGLLAAHSGTVHIDGRDVTRLPAHQRGFGVVFQSHALIPHLTVAENVAFGLRMRGVGHADRSRRADEALSLVRLPELGGRYPHQLSGGQQQRVALARAIAIEPRLLLLDEPFSALDRKLREELQRELGELTRRLNITSVFVTHDQQEAVTMSDRVVVMRNGRIVDQGAARSIFRRPSTIFAAEFLGFENLLPATRECEDGCWSYRIGASMLKVDESVANTSYASGGKVVLAIRGSQVRLLGPGRAEPNSLPAKIVGRTFTGENIRFDCLTEGGLSVTAVVPADRPGPELAVGDLVCALFPSGSIIVLTHETDTLSAA
jgi:putative spermidine/putrescine transport system ATP-binding protein